MYVSKGEAKVGSILQELRSDRHYKLIPQYVFEDLKSHRGGRLYFDYCLTYKGKIVCLIEYDGEQHFSHIKRFHARRSDFLSAQERDRIKNSYCLAHKIRLYRIPYWAINDIVHYQDLFQDQFLVRSPYHNDTVWREYLHTKGDK